MTTVDLQDEILVMARTRLTPLTPTEIAEQVGCHWQTAYRKLRGLAHQGLLIECRYDEEGYLLKQPWWRYILDPM